MEGPSEHSSSCPKGPDTAGRPGEASPGSPQTPESAAVSQEPSSSGLRGGGAGEQGAELAESGPEHGQMAESGMVGQDPARTDALAGQHPEQQGKKRKGLLRRLRRGRRRGGEKDAGRDHAALQRQQEQHQPEEADNRTLLRELRGLAGSLKRSFTTKRRRWG